MTLLSLVVIDIHTKKIMKKFYHLNEFSIFTRGKVREMITFISAEVAEKLETHKFQVYTHQFNNSMYKIFSRVFDDYAFICVATNEYPEVVAKKFLYDAKSGNGEVLIEEYQDPESKHTLLQVQNEVEETKGVLSKALVAVLERNDKLEDLVAKSEHLSAQTKMFFKSAKKKNKCCG